MNVREGIAVGLVGVSAHKMRSALTMLGVIFGVGAVISMVSIGSGAKEEALRQIELLGTNTLRIRPVKLEGTWLGEAKRKSPKALTREDFEAICRICPDRARGAMLKEREGSLKVSGERRHVETLAISPEYPEIVRHEVDRGRTILERDQKTAARVCVLGWRLAQDLPLSEPVGERVQLDQQWFEVVGVMKPKSAPGQVGTALDARDLDSLLILPLETRLKRFTKAPKQQDGEQESMSELSEIVIQCTSAESLDEATEIIERSLSRRHEGVKDFKIEIPEELMRQSQQTQRMFNMILSCVAGISLLVGGIGIMNIMLATVTERTREIGVRRSVGATRNDILGQFLIECLVVSAAGGLLGMALGMSFSKALTHFLKWPTVFSMGTILLSIGVAGATGVLFGLYPAYKASRLDPIESLRYE